MKAFENKTLRIIRKRKKDGNDRRVEKSAYSVLIIRYSKDQIKEDELNGACDRQREDDIQNFGLESLKEGGQSEDLYTSEG